MARDDERVERVMIDSFEESFVGHSANDFGSILVRTPTGVLYALEFSEASGRELQRRLQSILEAITRPTRSH